MSGDEFTFYTVSHARIVTFFDALVSHVYFHQNVGLHVIGYDDTVSFQKHSTEHNNFIPEIPEGCNVVWTLVSVLWPSVSHSSC